MSRLDFPLLRETRRDRQCSLASDESVKITMPYRSSSVPSAGSASIRSRREEAGQPQSTETAVAPGRDVDKPRNLAKGVTGERGARTVGACCIRGIKSETT